MYHFISPFNPCIIDEPNSSTKLGRRDQLDARLLQALLQWQNIAERTARFARG
jgi:hypothetical protein